MAPSIFLSRRQSFSITPNNPLQDKAFVGTVVGIVIGGIVFFILLTLLLCLYRENSPLKRCCGRRFKAEAERPPTSHLKQFDLGRDTPSTLEGGSRTNLVGGAAPMAMRENQYPYILPYAYTTIGFGLNVSLKKKRRRTRTSLDLSMLPLSWLLPWQVQAVPMSPTKFLSLPPLPSPPSLSLGSARSFSAASRSTTSLDLDFHMDRDEKNSMDYAPNKRRMVISGGSFTQYSWLMDIIHDHMTGLFKHSRLSQLGPYRLAKMWDAASEEGRDDSGYCSSPARTE